MLLFIVSALGEVAVEFMKPFQSPQFHVSLFSVPLHECVQKNCRDDTGMDGVAGAGLRFICGGKVRDYRVTILGTTMLARRVYRHMNN